MGLACWHAGKDGRYWMDIRVANLDLRLLTDSGLVDPLHQVGLAVDATVYDQLKRSGQLTAFQKRSARNASGRITLAEAGLVSAQVIDPVTKMPVGPVIQVYVFRGILGVPHRVGIMILHALRGCKVIWDLNQQTWCVEYP
jgi:hypothetical protein